MARLVTFNIRTSAAIKDLHHHWVFRKDSVLSTIKDLDADIIGLQEVRHRPLQFLSEGLGGYASIAAGRNDGQTKGEACPIFVGPNFTIDNAETRWFSPTPDIAGTKFEKVSQPRIATIVRTTEIATGIKVAFVETHLDTQFRSIREQSLELLHQWAQSDNIPWVIMGDFNCTIDSPEMAPLLDNGWSDALHVLPPTGEGAATFNGFKHRTDGPRIDHVLVPPGVTVTNAFIDRVEQGKVPSDHWPVVVDVDLKGLARTN